MYPSLAVLGDALYPAPKKSVNRTELKILPNAATWLMRAAFVDTGDCGEAIPTAVIPAVVVVAAG
jgi:hypothetical protein